MYIRPLSATDFYKTGHHEQYPEGTNQVYSNFTPRDDKHILSFTGEDFDHKVVFFGLQGICCWLLMDLWNRNFFDKPKKFVVKHYADRLSSSLGKKVDVSHIESLHDLGYLPIVIKALPEGSRVNIRVPLFTITNTLPEFFWLTNYLETQISAEIWKPITAATMAFEYRKVFLKYAEETGAPKEFVAWQGHDFADRGLSGIFDAAVVGAAHGTSFLGTDSILGLDYIDDYYQSETFFGGSVPATEHSVMCMGGEGDEVNTFRRLINEIYPKGIVSIVSDTWDFWQVITEYTKVLKSDIMSRDGKVVFRPDSGDPVKIICGSAYLDNDDFLSYAASNAVDAGYRYLKNKGKYYHVYGNHSTGYYQDEVEVTSEMKGAVECLWEIFGGTETDKGFKMLDSHVGLIYGDSINLDRAKKILEGLKDKGFASNNIVFGIGSFTYQYVTRDTFGCAIKSTYGEVNNVGRNIYKNPKTDSGVKKSAKGLIRVEKDGDDFVLYDCQTKEQEQQGELVEVFKNGDLLKYQSITEIREKLGW